MNEREHADWCCLSAQNLTDEIWTCNCGAHDKRNGMTAHELARALLEHPDVVVRIFSGNTASDQPVASVYDEAQNEIYIYCG
jgi:hypothetical protein